MTWGWVNGRMFHCGWAVPLTMMPISTVDSDKVHGRHDLRQANGGRDRIKPQWRRSKIRQRLCRRIALYYAVVPGNSHFLSLFSLSHFFILLFHTSSSSSLCCSPLPFSVLGLTPLTLSASIAYGLASNTPYLLFLFLRHYVHFCLNSLSLSLGPWVQWVNEFSVVSQWHWREERLSVSLCISNTLIPEFICTDMCTGTAYHALFLSHIRMNIFNPHTHYIAADMVNKHARCLSAKVSAINNNILGTRLTITMTIKELYESSGSWQC